ncbi:AMP-ligase [Betaproteobacteria bacterium]|nr:AMP-ligase [Betaproteobacteria bacterium]GHU15775.1 AMP-ligase [Betaproteobacteria bacterium]
MSLLPLLAHLHPEAIVARRGDDAITLRRFLADIARVVAVLPDCRHMLNLCADRYHFAVGLAANMVTGRISLLPSTHTPETLRQMAAFAPDCQILSDGGEADAHRYPLPVTAFPTLSTAAEAVTGERDVPRLAPAQHIAWVFTSGSTGVPQPHRKCWGRLAISTHATAAALGLDPTRPATFVGTVPPQHMFGFESTVLLSWLTGGAFDAGRPFYPADIAATLAHAPAPVVLVTTPFHLRTVLDEGIPLPTIDRVISATAPLPVELAHRAEAGFGAPLFEIYGSTETGQIATRRSATTPTWTLTRDVQLTVSAGKYWISGEQIDAPTPLGDLIEIVDARHFSLRGRNEDLINIAGKRTSLDYLNRQLCAIPGVRDGAFHLPAAERDGHVTRLAAFVVAPDIHEAHLRAALRERIDAAFMPRPLIYRDSLPRNATGKLPRASCEALLAAHYQARGKARHARSRSLTLAADHPACVGHFPGRPIVPGVVLLDRAARALAAESGLQEPCWRVGSVKFIRAIKPGVDVQLEWQAPGANGAIAFSLSDGAGVIASGSLNPATGAA